MNFEMSDVSRLLGYQGLTTKEIEGNEEPQIANDTQVPVPNTLGEEDENKET